ncbi:calcium-binding allergen Bet v 3-like [Humulus lupulus]|uniref:calcium-binding allergen Bet v 3-like n=1 Tax=Humulus lupulus TaxID=3486 RepID=UPI002B415C1A|nr:calcium-binding allergen Bet v 3-like [Humulus lupulus]
MEAAPASETEICSLSSQKRSSSSFRLRSPSLNTLRLRRIFDLFDKNNDGIITVKELGQALNLLGLEAEFAELESTIKSFIRPENPGLRFEDFVLLHQSLNETYFCCGDNIGEFENEEAKKTDLEENEKMSQEESDLSEAFKVFDEDGDGYISAKELQVVLGKLGFDEGNEIDRVEKMIISVDRNHDGRVDFFEFKDMMRSVIVRSA